MRRKIIMLVIGVMAFLALPLSTYADATPYFGPQGDDSFLWFGDNTFPRNSQQGITIDVDETSISFQSFIAEVHTDAHLIEDRKILRFYLLANKRIVDYFDPVYNQAAQDWQQDYWLRLKMEDWNIGSDVYFQIVAVTSDGPIVLGQDFVRYVVAWTNETPTYQLKPLPVTDSETHGWLSKIYDLLKELMDMLQSMLAQLDADIRKIYEISPETQANFDAALAELQSKLPEEQMKDQMNDAANVVKDSADRINNAQQQIKFGQINWMGQFTTSAVDFTSMMDQITLLRRILQITLWCEFFFFVILILRPRLTV